MRLLPNKAKSNSFRNQHHRLRRGIPDFKNSHKKRESIKIINEKFEQWPIPRTVAYRSVSVLSLFVTGYAFYNDPIFYTGIANIRNTIDVFMQKHNDELNIFGSAWRRKHPPNNSIIPEDMFKIERIALIKVFSALKKESKTRFRTQPLFLPTNWTDPLLKDLPPTMSFGMQGRILTNLMNQNLKGIVQNEKTKIVKDYFLLGALKIKSGMLFYKELVNELFEKYGGQLTHYLIPLLVRSVLFTPFLISDALWNSETPITSIVWKDLFVAADQSNKDTYHQSLKSQKRRSPTVSHYFSNPIKNIDFSLFYKGSELTEVFRTFAQILFAWIPISRKGNFEFSLSNLYSKIFGDLELAQMLSHFIYTVFQEKFYVDDTRKVFIKALQHPDFIDEAKVLGKLVVQDAANDKTIEEELAFLFVRMFETKEIKYEACELVKHVLEHSDTYETLIHLFTNAFKDPRVLEVVEDTLKFSGSKILSDKELWDLLHKVLVGYIFSALVKADELKEYMGNDIHRNWPYNDNIDFQRSRYFERQKPESKVDRESSDDVPRNSYPRSINLEKLLTFLFTPDETEIQSTMESMRKQFKFN